LLGNLAILRIKKSCPLSSNRQDIFFIYYSVTTESIGAAAESTGAISSAGSVAGASISVPSGSVAVFSAGFEVHDARPITRTAKANLMFLFITNHFWFKKSPFIQEYSSGNPMFFKKVRHSLKGLYNWD
jgi:hypothetical protein